MDAYNIKCEMFLPNARYCASAIDAGIIIPMQNTRRATCRHAGERSCAHVCTVLHVSVHTKRAYLHNVY